MSLLQGHVVLVGWRDLQHAGLLTNRLESAQHHLDGTRVTTSSPFKRLLNVGQRSSCLHDKRLLGVRFGSIVDLDGDRHSGQNLSVGGQCNFHNISILQ